MRKELPVMNDCPRFASCSAPVCPVDPAAGAVHLKGEKVCGYLLATGKTGAPDHYRDDPYFTAAVDEAARISAKWRDIGRKIKDAAGSPLAGRNLPPRPRKKPA